MYNTRSGTFLHKHSSIYSRDRAVRHVFYVPLRGKSPNSIINKLIFTLSLIHTSIKRQNLLTKFLGVKTSISGHLISNQNGIKVKVNNYSFLSLVSYQICPLNFGGKLHAIYIQFHISSFFFVCNTMLNENVIDP